MRLSLRARLDLGPAELLRWSLCPIHRDGRGRRIRPGRGRSGPPPSSRSFMALLSLRDVSLAFGGPRLLDHVDWQVERGERVSLLGRNGEGKSTLLKLIRGDIAPDEGAIIRQQGLRIARPPQEAPFGGGRTAFQSGADGLAEAGEPLVGSEHKVDAVISRTGLV